MEVCNYSDQTAEHIVLSTMRTRLLQQLETSWASFSQLHLALRIPLFVIAWPVLLGLFIFSRGKNKAVALGLLLSLTLFIQIPWVTAIAGGSILDRLNIFSSENGSSTKDGLGSSDPALSPVISVSYGAVTTNCTESYMTGTLEVKNSGNTPISGRAEVPVSNYEKFMIPLSGVFLDLAPGSTTVISLESGQECKAGQVVGQPTTAFTIPSEVKLQTLNLLDSFEWSAVKAICDKESELISLKATVRNISEFTLTAGIEANLANGERQSFNSFYGTIYKLPPGETREIDFGYGESCEKGVRGFPGPYTTVFETRFTY